MLLMALGGRWLDLGPEADLSHYRDVRDLVEGTYAGPVERHELLDDALKGMVAGLDPHSHYYTAAEVAALERETGGTYTGIGAVLTRDARVLWPWPGAPAERAGLRVGDRVLAVNGTLVADMTPGGFEDELRAAPDDAELTLEVQGRDGAPRTVRIRPEEVVEPSVRHARIADPEHGLGYVSIHAFTRHTPEELDAALSELAQRDLRGLVLDLRGNPGGVLPAAVEVANRFVREGVLVSTVSRGPRSESRADPEQADWEGLPLVVLQDGTTASASEVLAGALQDHRAAVLIGERSYGKGVVQALNRFERERAVVKLTSGYYTTPAGRLIDRAFVAGAEFGIEPDLVVPLDEVRRARVHAFLSAFAPPASAQDELEAWEREEQTELFQRHPEDPVLAAALELLRGRRPGPRLAARTPARPEGR
jgi:carboxyl-terminal processing protease